MNVPRTLKKGSLIVLGAVTLATFNLNVCRSATSSNSTTTKKDTTVVVKNTISRGAADILARNIYHESRGQSKEGQYAVGIVTMNRVKSGKFPHSVERVITQPGQFSWYTGKQTKITDIASFNEAKEIAKNILEERGSLYEKVHNDLKGALYFCVKGIKLSSKRKVVKVIGSHKFYI